ncbi:MAG TPA: hypothetical protein VN843_34410 [Anaerolineales bacterium]|nr:hypothetical protein [Anaerolineales bacterium]
MTYQICARCGFQNLPTDWQCFQCRAALSSTDRDSVWRKNSLLIMTRQAHLPARCIKCNDPAERKLKRNLSWHHPALYLVIFAGALFYVLVALILRKTATIEVGLCENHSAARRRDIIITWTLGLLSVGSFFLAAQLEDPSFAGTGVLLILSTAIYGIVRVRVVRPTKIDENLIWLKGFDRNYLADFPEWHRSN